MCHQLPTHHTLKPTPKYGSPFPLCDWPIAPNLGFSLVSTQQTWPLIGRYTTNVASYWSILMMVIVTQLVGPVLGGVLHEVGGFFFPFVVMGALQVVLAFSR